jgi:hypothetical protein
MRLLSIYSNIHPREKLVDKQTHWVKKLMPSANLMRILYKKELLNEYGPVSRLHDFLPVDKLYMRGEIL